MHSPWLAFWVVVVQTTLFAEGGSDNNNGNGQQIPLRKLAGTFAEAAQGSAVLCHDPDTGSPVGCDAPGAVAVPYAYVSVGPVIEDAEGNGCGSFTATYSNLPPNASPPLVIKFQIGGKTTSY